MMILEGGLIYRIDRETFFAACQTDEMKETYQSLSDTMNDVIEKLHEEYENMGPREAQVRLLAFARSDPFNTTQVEFYHKVWNAITSDMEPEQIAEKYLTTHVPEGLDEKLHDLGGACIDLDNQDIITCADCKRKNIELLAEYDRIRADGGNPENIILIETLLRAMLDRRMAGTVIPGDGPGGVKVFDLGEEPEKPRDEDQDRMMLEMIDPDDLPQA